MILYEYEEKQSECYRLGLGHTGNVWSPPPGVGLDSKQVGFSQQATSPLPGQDHDLFPVLWTEDHRACPGITSCGTGWQLLVIKALQRNS